LREVLSEASEADIEGLLTAIENPVVGLARVEEFAEGARVTGRVVLATYHPSKGRKFDAVGHPGSQEGLEPAARWNTITA
jgi:superfamily I DNA/RNA helicase